MKREYEASADTVEEAIAIARHELGISEFEGVPEVLQYPKKSLFFGKIKQQARVKVTFEDMSDILADKPKAERQKTEKRQPKPEKPAPQKAEKPVSEAAAPAIEKVIEKAAPAAEKAPEKAAPAAEKPAFEKKSADKTTRPERKERPAPNKAEPAPALLEKKPAPLPEKAEEKEPEAKPAEEILREPSEELMPQVNAAKAYLEEIFKSMGVTELEMTFLEGDNKNVHVKLVGEGIGAVIGKRGETLDAIQYLVCLVANHLEGDYVRFTLNAGNYREKREETLKALAMKMAKKVQRTGRSTALEPMNPYERRIIHSVITEIEGVYSKSTGEEPNRKVIIKPSGRKGGRPPRSRDDRPERGGKGGYNSRPRAPRNPSEPKSDAVSEAKEPKPAAKLDDGNKLYSKIEL